MAYTIPNSRLTQNITALAGIAGTEDTGYGAAAFRSTVYVYDNTANGNTLSSDTTITATIERHPDLLGRLSGAMQILVRTRAQDAEGDAGFNSRGRYTPISGQVISWSDGDITPKTVDLTFPAQTLNGFHEVELELYSTNATLGTTRTRFDREAQTTCRMETGQRIVSDSAVLAYHVDPVNGNATGAGTFADPTTTVEYLTQTVLSSHPDTTKSLIIYQHPDPTNKYSGEVNDTPWDLRFGGTATKPIKIEPLPGAAVDVSGASYKNPTSAANAQIWEFTDCPYIHLGRPPLSANDVYDLGPGWVKYTGSSVEFADGNDYSVFQGLDHHGYEEWQSDGSIPGNMGGVFLHAGKGHVIRKSKFRDQRVLDGDGINNHNISGIKCYYTGETIVEDCYFDDLGTASYCKNTPKQTTLGDRAWVHRRNIFTKEVAHAIEYNRNEESVQGWHDITIYENVRFSENTVRWASTTPGIFTFTGNPGRPAQGGVFELSDNLMMYNNTFEIDQSISTHPVVNVRVFNNVFKETSKFADGYYITNSRYPQHADEGESIIKTCDWNMVDTTLIGRIILNDGTITTYANSAAWQAASNEKLLSYPDNNSFQEAITINASGVCQNANATGNGFGGFNIGHDGNSGSTW